MKERKTAVALGLFDGVHLGHAQVLSRIIGREGQSSLVFTFGGNSLLPKFGDEEQRYLITSYEDRRAAFERLEIEYIYAPAFEELKDMSPEEFIQSVLIGRLNAAYVVCGYDFTFGKEGAGSAKLLSVLCRKRGIECEIVPAVKIDGQSVSSTLIRELISGGYIAAADRLLGYELSYTLPVLRGNQVGRTIGFPTINQELPFYLTEPHRGVYLSRVTVDGQTYKGITDIGVKPTVKDDEKLTVETHIIGFDGDLYDRDITISLICFIRGEKKFEDLGKLKEQLEKDLEFAKNERI